MFSRKSRAKANEGFTFIEILLAIAMAGILYGMVTSMMSTYRVAMRFNGSETFGGVAIALNPSEVCIRGERITAVEMAALANESVFVVVTKNAVQESNLLSKGRFASLANLNATQLLDADAVQAALETDGLTFNNTTGYTVFFIGSGLSSLGALVVEESADTAANGDAFQIYKSSLYGPMDGGFGMLYQYQFASPSACAQILQLPSWNASLHAWRVVLPDASLPTERPDGSAASAQNSRQSYEIPSHI